LNITKWSLELVADEDFEVVGNSSSPQDVYEVCKRLKLDRMPEEHIWILLTDSALNVIGVSEVSHGGISGSYLDPPNIFKRALLANARSIIMVHNHPSGDTSPSDIDFDITRRVRDAGRKIGIELLDHVIVSHKGYTSMKEGGWI